MIGEIVLGVKLNMLAITLGSGKVFWLFPIFISLYFTLFVCNAYPKDAAIESMLELLLVLLLAIY